MIFVMKGSILRIINNGSALPAERLLVRLNHKTPTTARTIYLSARSWYPDWKSKIIPPLTIPLPAIQMRHFIIATISFLFLALQSCNTSLTDYATDWSNNVKKKIIEDASQQPDKTIYDSSSYNVTLYKGDNKLKFFHLNPKFNDKGQMLSLDTLFSIFFSTDQHFELLRELCPVVDRNFEGIRYKGEYVGLAELRYCDGKIKESGFRFNDNVGVWKEYDPNGKIIKETDYGNVEKLEKLQQIRYYR